MAIRARSSECTEAGFRVGVSSEGLLWHLPGGKGFATRDFQAFSRKELSGMGLKFQEALAGSVESDLTPLPSPFSPVLEAAEFRV